MQLKYFVFAPKSGLVEQHGDVYQMAYEAWRLIWADVFREVGHRGDLSADEFIRHDRCAVLVDNGKVAGVHLYSFFDLDVPLQRRRRYLAENFDEASLVSVRVLSGARLMTMEYLSVPPEFRGAKAGLAVAETLIALGLKVFRSETDLDGVIACTRNSRRVNEMAAALGFQTIARDRQAHGESADLILFPAAAPVATVAQNQIAIERLWQSRVDLRPTEKANKKITKRTKGRARAA